MVNILEVCQAYIEGKGLQNEYKAEWGRDGDNGNREDRTFVDISDLTRYRVVRVVAPNLTSLGNVFRALANGGYTSFRNDAELTEALELWIRPHKELEDKAREQQEHKAALDKCIVALPEQQKSTIHELVKAVVAGVRRVATPSESDAALNAAYAQLSQLLDKTFKAERARAARTGAQLLEKTFKSERESTQDTGALLVALQRLESLME